MLTHRLKTHDEISALVQGSPEADQRQSPTRFKDAASRSAVLPLSTFLAIHDSPPGFVLRRLLPTGVTALVDGTGQAGRSVALQLALAVATGVKVFERKPQSGAVLYLVHSSSRRPVRRQLQQLCRQWNARRGLDRFAVASLPSKSELIPLLQGWLKRTDAPRLIVIDAPRSPNQAPNDHLLRQLARLVRPHAAAVLLTFPPAASASVPAWSLPWQVLAAYPSLHGALVLKPLRSPGEASLLSAHPLSDSERELRLRRAGGSGLYELIPPGQGKELSPARRRIQRVIAAAKHPLSAQQIAQRLKKPTETVRRLLDTMKNAGQLRAKLDHGHNLYRLSG
jgi:hypothetical protein